MRTVVLDLVPFGRIEIEIRGAVIADQNPPKSPVSRVYAEVKSNPFVPIVSTNADHARALGQALIEIADALDRVIEGLTPPAERFR